MIAEITTKKELENLAKESAPCWEGLSLEGLEEQLEEIDPAVNIVYCTGGTYNKAYHLSGDNAYPENLTIVFLTDWSIAMMSWKLKFGCRWADDVRDNNLAREGR